MITVVNRRHHRGGGVYIGRLSLLGNPFKIGEHGTRKEVIAKYRVWLWQQIQQRGPVYRELLHLAETGVGRSIFDLLVQTTGSSNGLPWRYFKVRPHLD